MPGELPKDRLDLRGLHPVAVNLEHIPGAADHDQIAVFVPFPQITAVEQPAPERFAGLLRTVDVAAEKGILKANLSALARLHFLSVRVKQADWYQIGSRLAHGTQGIRPVNDKLADRIAYLAHGIPVLQRHTIQIQAVGALAPDRDKANSRAQVLADDPKRGGRQKGMGNVVLRKITIESEGVFDGFIRQNVQTAIAVNIPHYDIEAGHTVNWRNQCFVVCLFRALYGVLDDCIHPHAAVLLQNALRRAGGAGGIERKRHVVVVGPRKAGQRRRLHDLRPESAVDHKLAAAVLLNEGDALRRKVVLCHCASGPGLPHADHGDDDLHASRQADHHHVLPPEAVLLQPGVYPCGQFVHLRAGQALRMPRVIQHGKLRMAYCILLKTLHEIRDRAEPGEACHFKVPFSNK